MPTTVGLRRSRTRTMRPWRAAIGFGRIELDQHLVALHGAVDLVGRNEISSFPLSPARRFGDWAERSRSRRDADRGGRQRDCRSHSTRARSRREAALGRLQCSRSSWTSWPRAVSRANCSSSRRRSRPPPSPSSRTNCLYPAFRPAEAAIRATSSRSVIRQD